MLGEKPLAYFLGLENRKAKGKTVLALKDEKGRLITNNKEILRMQSDILIVSILKTQTP